MKTIKFIKMVLPFVLIGIAGGFYIFQPWRSKRRFR